MSTSYGVVHRRTRNFIIVNAGSDDRVDVLIDFKPDSQLAIQNYSDAIKTVIFDDATPYRVFRMTFTANNGSVVGATFKGNQSENNNRSAVSIAKLVMWCDSYRNDRSKFLEYVVKSTSKLIDEEKDICAICHHDYQVEDLIGTLRCKHSFHDQCIKEWLRKKDNCPMCRGFAFVHNMKGSCSEIRGGL